MSIYFLLMIITEINNNKMSKHIKNYIFFIRGPHCKFIVADKWLKFYNYPKKNKRKKVFY